MSRHQRGYTLIEIMVSLLLGLMLTAGFGSLFVQMQKSATIQRSLSYMMDDGRYVLEIFGKELRRTGFLRNKLAITGGAGVIFSADSNVLGSSMSFQAGEYIRGQYDTAGYGAEADQPFNINRLTLRYQLNDVNELAVADPSSTNSPCTKDVLLQAGEDPASQVHVVTLYFYVKVDGTNGPTLYCEAKRQQITNCDSTSPIYDTTSNQCLTLSASPEPLISNVQELFIGYGIDSDGDGTANYYVDANNVTNWQQIVAAKLSVALRSTDDNLSNNAVTYTIDGDPNSPYTAADNRLYRVFSTTIAFRNSN